MELKRIEGESKIMHPGNSNFLSFVKTLFSFAGHILFLLGSLALLFYVSKHFFVFLKTNFF